MCVSECVIETQHLLLIFLCILKLCCTKQCHTWRLTELDAPKVFFNRRRRMWTLYLNHALRILR